MAKNFVQSGHVITLTAPATVASGACAIVGSIVGVAALDITSGASGDFYVDGVFDLAKDTSAPSAGCPVTGTTPRRKSRLRQAPTS